MVRYAGVATEKDRTAECAKLKQARRHLTDLLTRDLISASGRASVGAVRELVDDVLEALK
jgi:hypothetical protein